MAEEKSTAYQNIKKLKILCGEEYLPSLKRQAAEVKKDVDTILRELHDREKELTRIRQEQKAAELKAAEEGGENVSPATDAEPSFAPPQTEEKPVQTVSETPKEATAPIKQTEEKTDATPVEQAPAASSESPEKAQRPSWIKAAAAPPRAGEGQRKEKIIFQSSQGSSSQSRPPQREYRGDGGGYGDRRPPREGGYQGTRDNRGASAGGYPPRTGGYNSGTRPGPGGAARPGAPMGARPARPPYGAGGQNRTPGGRPSSGGNFTAPAIIPKETAAKTFTTPPKKKPLSKVDDKKVMNKKALIKKGYVYEADEDERMGSKKIKSKKSREIHTPTIIKIDHAVVNSSIVPIKILSEKIGVTAVEITKKLFKEGIIKTINDSLEFDVAEYIAAESGVTLELKVDKTAEETLLENYVSEGDDSKDLVSRPPIVTVMGHVDHGKTSLLDAIRKANVTAGEAGGITQHIGAYTVKAKKRDITFIDTPGHEAFTAMRKRGAEVTDIAILVVAADDGVMPQTVEAVNHAKAAGVPIIVAVNKIDKTGANLDKIRQQLADQGVLCEEWGGDAILVPVSAHTKEGIDTLLEMILLVSDDKELKANPARSAKGVILEAKLDKGKGPVASVIVQNGTLKIGDIVLAGTATGKIRAMIDDKGRSVKEAGPSYAVSVLGFSEVPQAGDEMHVVEDEKVARQIADERRNKTREAAATTGPKFTLDDVFEKISEGQIKGLNIIVKADVQGSVEAVKQALAKLSNEEVKVNIIHGGAGAITESDVTLAETTSSIIIGFNVRPDAKAKQTAERDNVDIRLYRIIYDAIDDIKSAMTGMLAPKFKETVIGETEVRNTFKVSSIGTIAGCYVTSGKIVRNCGVRIVRDGIVVFEGKLSSLKRFKDDVKEVASGYECGLTIENYNDIKEGDVIEAFINEQVQPSEK